MKKFIIKTLFYLIPFFGVYGYYCFAVKPNVSGDLGILGQIPFGKDYNENLKRNYLTENWVVDTFAVSGKKPAAKKRVKIFTIGDSFSQQGIFGYQNYLAHILGDTVINVKTEGINRHIQTAVSLLNSGLLDSTICRMVIIQQVDRDAVMVLNQIDFEKPYEVPEKSKQAKDANKNGDLYNLCSWIRLQFNYENPIVKHDLKQEYFTHSSFSHELFHYYKDLWFEKTMPADTEKAGENLIRLNEKFAEKGIQMVFLLASDKYDVYRPFMTDDSLPIDTTTSFLSNIPGVFVFDTKGLLQKMVQSGEKDVYMVNDSHWSYKGSEAVAGELACPAHRAGRAVLH
ncbi:MAG: hypothetical protein LBR60_03615 [Fibrobacter sp.]|jgi:hypothetical protein|nr:hypothetical protein [Fibrobacter sp.]